MSNYVGRHSLQTANHRLESWIYADATARMAATGFTVDDVGRVAYQQSDNSYWRLSDDAPITWQAVTSGLTNPLTTQDDIIVGGAGGVLTRLAKGTDGQVLTVDPTTHQLIWKTPAIVLTGIPRSLGWYMEGDVAIIAGYGPVYKLDANTHFDKLVVNVKTAGVGDTRFRLYTTTDLASWSGVGTSGTDFVLLTSGTLHAELDYGSSNPATAYTAGLWFRLDVDALGSTPPKSATVQIFGRLF